MGRGQFLDIFERRNIGAVIHTKQEKIADREIAEFRRQAGMETQDLERVADDQRIGDSRIVERLDADLVAAQNSFRLATSQMAKEKSPSR